ncbi:hypothetical protein QTN25_002149 [Entamoeba marina]
MVGYSVDYFSSEIKDKLTTSFSGMTGNKTKNVILAYPSKNNIRQFINNNQLKFIRLEFSTTPNDGIIQEINNINKSVRVCVSIHSTSPATITNLNKSLGSNISIINTIKSVGLITNYHEDVDMCVNPFESENSIKTYEKYYLPTKLIFQKFQDNSYDFKEFEFVKDITFEENTVMHDMEIRLPISTQTINFKYRYEFNTLWKITNWNELINIKEINDFGNIDIPYPQIKYEHDQSTITRANLLERMCGYASLLCCLYLFVPTLTMIFSVIFHPFNFEYLSNSIRNQINIFLYISSTFWMIFSIVFFEYKLTEILRSVILFGYGIAQLLYVTSLRYYTSIYWISIMSMTSLPVYILFHFYGYKDLLQLTKSNMKKFIRITCQGAFITPYVEKFLNFSLKIEHTLTLSVFFVYSAEIAIGLIISFFSTSGLIAYGCILIIAFVCCLYFVV